MCGSCSTAVAIVKCLGAYLETGRSAGVLMNFFKWCTGLPLSCDADRCPLSLQGHVSASAHAGGDEGAWRLLCPVPWTDARDAAQLLRQRGQHDRYVVRSKKSLRARPPGQQNVIFC